MPPASNRLQITSSPTNADASPSNQTPQQRQPFRPLNNNQFRGTGYPRTQRAYQTSVTENSENKDDLVPNPKTTYHGDRSTDSSYENEWDSDHDQDDYSGHDVNFLTDLLPSHHCTECDDNFVSRNQLRKHQCPKNKDVLNASIVPSTSSLPNSLSPRVITSDITPTQSNGGPGYAFRN